ncbi:MAG: hypothetical protein U9P10_06235 [Thermodesulfobacteriota bacterium]|nr:hypothetical protein [Thermodesulfobacteriota bacterium]
MPIVQAQSGNDTVTAQDVKKETKELINTLQQYTVDQRDQAIKEADKEKSRKKTGAFGLVSRQFNQGTRLHARFGLDGLINLIPGFGDTIGALISS